MTDPNTVVADRSAPADAAALTFRQVSKSFPGVKALDDVTFTVARGEVHGVVGENGAGKSTLMAVASGALRPDDGEVWIDGSRLLDVSPESARALGIAIVRQEPALMPDLTVAENLYLATSAEHRPSPARLAEWSRDALGAWGEDLPFTPNDRVEQLGPQQRFIVEICRALVQQPMVLILDEPTEHLMSAEAELLFRHVRDYAASGRAVVYISHRINEVKEIADRITVLRNGRCEGTRDAGSLSEQQIVDLIIGRTLDVYFPEKNAEPGEVMLRIDAVTSHGLSETSLEVRRGEIIGLAGIDGNGQSTFLRALAGLSAARGRVAVRTAPFRAVGRRLAIRDRVAYLTGDRHTEGVLPSLSVSDNIAFRNLARISRHGWFAPGAVSRFTTKVVRDFRVKTPDPDQPIESLSGGNQQKALLGSVLAADPAVLLIEEPTQGVDVGARGEIYRLLRDATPTTSILVRSSSTLELAGLADRVLVFSRGRVIRELEGQEVTDEAITAAMLTAESQRERTARPPRPLSRAFATDRAPVVVVAALIALIGVLGASVNPLFLGGVNIASVLGLAVPLALVAFGQICVLLTGGIDLSTGPLMGFVVIIGSYYLIDGSPTGSMLTGWGFILLAAIVVGVVNWVLVDVARIAPIIATLATYMAVQAISFTLRPTPGGIIGADVTTTLSTQLGIIPVGFVLVVVLGVLLDLALRRTRAGVAVRAVGSRAESARVNGLSPRRVRLGAYLASSVLSALAGVFFMEQIGTGDAGAGITYTLLGITAAVIGGASVFGGRASFVGALLGAVLIQAMASVSAFLRLSSDWQYYLVGGFTIAAVAVYSLARDRARAAR
jgi:ribose transport system ATP-binding protein